MNLCFTEQVENYPGYLICRDGRVLSLARISKRKGKKGNLSVPGRILKVSINENGYPRVRLSYKGKSKMFYIHYLMANAFIPNPGNKPQVNHLDGNKENNILKNLEWATPKENSDHSQNVLKNIKDKKVEQLLGNKSIKVFLKLKDVKKDGFGISPIGQRCRGNIKGPYMGFNWRFYD